MKFKIISTLTLLIAFVVTLQSQQNPDLGIFESSSDIGNVKHKGTVVFNATDSTYTISGSGTNMWFNTDELHFAYKMMSGDVSLEATIEMLGAGVDPHRKACLMIRQSLEPDAPYVDIAVHGDGLTSMQYRETKGGLTHEVKSNRIAPKKALLQKKGKYIAMQLASANGDLAYAGGSLRMNFEEPYYIGLGVCSHNSDVVETIKFTKVSINKIEEKSNQPMKVKSTLEILDIASLNRRVVHLPKEHIEAPNWTPDGKTLIYNSQGLLYSIPVEGGSPELIPTDFANKINNDHGISPDGTQMVISDQTESGSSIIYSIPIAGGVPKKITPLSPSYWHGWSPDGKTLAYCAERNGNYDIYTIPFEGGEEVRLTDTEGLDDGPDYSPDGKYIYFNSTRTGTMQIWRMKPDGSEQQQITTDKYNDWFAHPSPDGKWLVYVTFNTDVPAGDHPPNKDVMLRLMNLESKEVMVLAKIFGGQGTINVPSWSPDSQQIAFVSYAPR
ncbi:MAG: TolB family protein [Maribacter sp.]|nr:TolB family protein [Maribacter sp.]